MSEKVATCASSRAAFAQREQPVQSPGGERTCSAEQKERGEGKEFNWGRWAGGGCKLRLRTELR